MGQFSAIEWTDHTFNPWWGCVKVSPGCTNCYAETWAKRYGGDLWGPRKSRRTFGLSHWQEPLKWQRTALEQGCRYKVFCASMADVFEDDDEITEERAKLWQLIERTPNLDWLLLTKRPENMLRFTPWKDEWPTNAWAMTSVENQELAEKRVPILTRVPAVVRGLSVEPLIGAVDLSPWLTDINWVIVGGESGRNARPMEVTWVRQLRDQCLEYKVPFFFKQWGEWSPLDNSSGTVNTSENKLFRKGKKASGRILDGQTWDQLPTYTDKASVTVAV